MQIAILPLLSVPARAQTQAEPRLAFIVGNDGYANGALATTANDAGLLAETLRTAGFDVTGARDLDRQTFLQSFDEFIAKLNAAGPNAVAFVYVSGYGIQFQGVNYYVPIGATLESAAVIPVQTVRLSDMIAKLAATPAKARILVADAARINPFQAIASSIAGGLALVEPPPGMLVAFNAAPGTVIAPETGPYGAYMQALGEMIREPGLGLDDVFSRARLRANELSKGAQTPWHASTITTPFSFFARAANAPPPPVASAAELRAKPIASFSEADAYAAALERDTLQGYQDFLAAYPSSAYAHRIEGLLAARREALTWRRTVAADTARAYWSYLKRYRGGPHAAEARRRLAALSAPIDPPVTFVEYDYDVPPPLPIETVYVESPYIVFDDPVYYPPPPRPPLIFLPVVPVWLPPPPPPPAYAVFLPVPVAVPLPFAAVLPPPPPPPPPLPPAFPAAPGGLHPLAIPAAVAAGVVAGKLLSAPQPPKPLFQPSPAQFPKPKPFPGGAGPGPVLPAAPLAPKPAGLPGAPQPGLNQQPVSQAPPKPLPGAPGAPVLPNAPGKTAPPVGVPNAGLPNAGLPNAGSPGPGLPGAAKALQPQIQPGQRPPGQPAQAAAPLARPTPEVQARPPIQARPQAQLRPQVQPRPQFQPRPRLEARPQAQIRPQARPQFQPRPQAQPRPQFQPRPQPRQVQAPRAAPRPAPPPRAAAPARRQCPPNKRC